MTFKGYSGWKALGFNSYQEYLMSQYWKDKRDFILEHFGNKCIECGTEKGLNVHHKNYDSVGNENTEDVTVLCFKCHKEEHNKNEGDSSKKRV